MSLFEDTNPRALKDLLAQAAAAGAVDSPNSACTRRRDMS